MTTHNRPYLRGKTIIGSLPSHAQRYYLTWDGGKDPKLKEFTETMCEKVEFHEILAQHGVTVFIHPDWHIGFEGTPEPDTIEYGNLIKAVWDNFKAEMSEFNLVVVDNWEGKVL